MRRGELVEQVEDTAQRRDHGVHVRACWLRRVFGHDGIPRPRSHGESLDVCAGRLAAYVSVVIVRITSPRPGVQSIRRGPGSWPGSIQGVRGAAKR